MMTKAEQAQIAQRLALLFSAFPQAGPIDVDLQMEVYLLAVEDFEFQDVDAAIKRIIQGGEGHESRSFAPSTAELCQEIRRRREMREILGNRRTLRVVKGDAS